MARRRIYLDNNATTPCDPRVIESMLPYFSEKFGNAASRNHAFGWEAEEAVNFAREQVCKLIAADSKEVVFTSGSTESINLAIKGVYQAYQSKGNHIVTVQTEHKAVLDVCESLEKKGAKITYLPVKKDGIIDLDELKDALTDQTILVSVMWANNETGVIQPMKEIGKICREADVLLMSDATQAVGKIPVHPRETGVDLITFSAHKIFGPKGIGALYLSRNDPRVVVRPIIEGGGHERGFRSGTLNVPGIVGLGKACEIAADEMSVEAERLSKLRDHLESELLNRIDESFVNGSREYRMPHVTNLSIRCIEAETLLMNFNQEVAMSTGSACTSASLDPSHVLLAMGLTDESAHSSVRMSLGRFNNNEEIEIVIVSMVRAVDKMRSMSPLWQMYKEGIQVN
jgi:cysteine desulfurase